MACLERLLLRLGTKAAKRSLTTSMTFQILKAVVIDDALGAPARGTISSDDKDDWIEVVSTTEAAAESLRQSFQNGYGPNLDSLLAALTGEKANLDKLWTLHQSEELPAAQLGILFRGAALRLESQGEKARVVVEKLQQMLGAANVLSFPSIDSAVEALASADVAFVDFFLSNSETEDEAVARITSFAGQLKRAKLLFFMSSRASLEVQQDIRRRIGVRTAFFEVMRKTDITSEFLAAKLEAKQASFDNNRSLEAIIQTLVEATKNALEEFDTECQELEVHDLLMLDLARLDAEGESLAEYLTWLFSESIAAKTRRRALPTASQRKIQTDAIGFTGQIHQKRVLFEQFSEVVFGPSVGLDSPIRFGELLCFKSHSSSYLLVLTPACDLQRCEQTKAVLCVQGSGEAYVGSKPFAREKLYGKQDDGRLCHLYTTKGNAASSTMINWSRDQIVTYTVQELRSDKFSRVALMNELFAQEVKEEVLRAIGRVGTQIDPPPPMALHAKIRWKNADNATYLDAQTPRESFISALVTYSEQKEGKLPTVVLSDEFRLWIRTKVEGSLAESETLHVKLQNCVSAAVTRKQFQMNKFAFKQNELLIKVEDPNDTTPVDMKAYLEITLAP